MDFGRGEREINGRLKLRQLTAKNGNSISSQPRKPRIGFAAIVLQGN